MPLLRLVVDEILDAKGGGGGGWVLRPKEVRFQEDSKGLYTVHAAC